MMHSQPENPDSGKRPIDPSFVQKGGVWVVAQFIVMALWLGLTPVGHPLTHSILLRTFAGGLFGVGAVAGVAGVRVLGKSRTAFPMPPEHAQLIRNGIYSLIRHPLYTSLIALSFGWACLWKSGAGALLACVQAVLLDAKARREERWLREKFPDYAEYATRVRRLIPWAY